MYNKQRFLIILNRFSKLNFHQWYWLFIAIYKLLYASLMMRFLGFKWVKQKMTAYIPPANANNNKSLKIARQLHESIRLAARCLPFSVECLPKAIVLAEMLQKRHIPAEVKLGVNRSEQTLQGHAWVLVFGNNIAELADINSKFTELKF